MKTKLMMILMILAIHTTIMANTPYHSLDENNYDQVVQALEKPEWLARYCYYEFSYGQDKYLYGVDDFWVSAKTMFFKKQGDCEDYAEFINQVLRFHGYDSVVYGIYTINQAHAIVLFNYKNKWVYMDCKNNILHQNYDNPNQALNDCYKNETTGIIRLMDLNDIIYDIKNNTPKKIYISQGRLKLHNHLTMASSGFHIYISDVFFLDGFRDGLRDSYKSVYKNLNKEAIGYLYEINNKYINKVGISLSGHGYYSSLVDCNKMLSFHGVFLYSKLGLTGYIGDYKGIDIDVNIFNFKTLKSYVCLRDFQVIDCMATYALFNKFFLEFNKYDKQYDFNIKYKINNNYLCSISFTKATLYIENKNINIEIFYNYISHSIGTILKF